ncbi:MAG: hypothetical protein AAF581_09770 [Planctomycetota bacterium]
MTLSRLCCGLLIAFAAIAPAHAGVEKLVVDPGKTVKKRPRLGDVPLGSARIGARRETPNRILSLDTRAARGMIEGKIRDRGREFHLTASPDAAGQRIRISIEVEFKNYTYRRIRRGRTERHEWQVTSTTRKKTPIDVIVTVGDLPHPVVALGEEMFLPLPGAAVWNGEAAKKKSRASFRGSTGGYYIRGEKLGKISNTSLRYRIEDVEERQRFQYEVVDKATELSAAKLVIGGSLTIDPSIASTLGLSDAYFLKPYRNDGGNVVHAGAQDGALVLTGLAPGKTRLWLACVGRKKRSSLAVQCYVDVTVTAPESVQPEGSSSGPTSAQIISSLRRHFLGGESKESLCKELGVTAEQFDRWAEKLFLEGGRVFETRAS